MEVKDPFALDAIPRRVMPLIFVVDTSGSMAGEKIASVNTAVRETLNDVGEISKNNADAQIKVAALQFSSGAQWMYPQPMESETFKWQDLEALTFTRIYGGANRFKSAGDHPSDRWSAYRRVEAPSCQAQEQSLVQGRSEGGNRHRR